MAPTSYLEVIGYAQLNVPSLSPEEGAKEEISTNQVCRYPVLIFSPLLNDLIEELDANQSQGLTRQASCAISINFIRRAIAVTVLFKGNIALLSNSSRLCRLNRHLHPVSKVELKPTQSGSEVARILVSSYFCLDLLLSYNLR